MKAQHTSCRQDHLPSMMPCLLIRYVTLATCTHAVLQACSNERLKSTKNGAGDQVEALLRCQLAVSASETDGSVLDATGESSEWAV